MDRGNGECLRQLISRAAANPLLRRMLRNSGYLLSANGLATAGSMLQGALAARLIGVEGLGIIGLVTDFATNVNRLTSFRMGQLVVRYVGEYGAADDEERAAAAFKAAGLIEIASSLVAVVLIVLLAPLAATVLAHDPDATPLFMLYGVAILANLMNESATGLLQLNDRFGLLARITVGQSLLTLVLMVLAFASGGGLTEVVLVYTLGKAAGAVATTALALVEARRRWGAGWWRARLPSLASRWREMARFATSTNLATTITLVTRDSELLWLGLLSDPVQVGYYKIARALAGIVALPVEPMISTTYRETRGRGRSPPLAERALLAAQREPARRGLDAGGRLRPGGLRPMDHPPRLYGRVPAFVPGAGGVAHRGGVGQHLLLESKSPAAPRHAALSELGPRNRGGAQDPGLHSVGPGRRSDGDGRVVERLFRRHHGRPGAEVHAGPGASPGRPGRRRLTPCELRPSPPRASRRGRPTRSG